MITIEQILEADDNDLRRLAGEVLQPERNEHSLYNGQYHQHKYESQGHKYVADFYKCDKCGEWCQTILWTDNHSPAERIATNNSKCMADWVPLRWFEAMIWRKWAVEKFGKEYYRLVMEGSVALHLSSLEDVFCVVSDTEPKHYIQAACICEIKHKERK